MSAKPDGIAENRFSGLWFEEAVAGQTFRSTPVTVTESQIIDFAMRWDPQPFHVSRADAADGIFGELSASGVHTIALTTRMFVDSGIFRGTAVCGLGLDETQFLLPLLPGDSVSATFTIVDKRRSRKADRGVVQIRLELFNQQEKAIFSMKLSAFIRCKDASGGLV